MEHGGKANEKCEVVGQIYYQWSSSHGYLESHQGCTNGFREVLKPSHSRKTWRIWSLYKKVSRMKFQQACRSRLRQVKTVVVDHCWARMGKAKGNCEDAEITNTKRLSALIEALVRNT